MINLDKINNRRKKGRKNGKPPAPRTEIHNIKSLCIFWERRSGVTQKCRLSWLTNSALVFEHRWGAMLRGLSQWIQLWRFKGTVGQIGSAWEWYHWIGLEKDINCYRFLFFIFGLDYLIRVRSSESLHAKMNPTSYLFGSRFACAQTAIFSAELHQKCGRYINYSVDCGLWVKNSNIPQSNIDRHFTFEV
jgi:hypothetical protein